MTFQPNRRSTSSRRLPTPLRGHLSPIVEKKPNWILWTFLGIVLVSVVVLVAWRLQYQENWRQNDEKITALLDSADKLIQDNHEDEAEAVVSKGLGLIPGDERCQKMIERINTKREMIRQRKAEASEGALLEAEQLAKTDIALAIDALDRIVGDASLTAEAHKTAVSRIAALNRGVCSLLMPKDWPADTVLTLDSITKDVLKGKIDGIVAGKHTLTITRYGFRDPLPMELNFRSLDPLPLPAVAWQLRGAKVFVKSLPSGAAVWWHDKDTGKVTPCEIEDVDDGPVEFLLKHPKYEATPLKGEVKNRQPLSVTATLKPSDAPPP